MQAAVKDWFKNWSPEINAVKVEVAKNAEQLVKADVQIGQNAKSLADLQFRMGNIETNTKVQGNAVVGLKNDINQVNQDMKAGGNISIGASDKLLMFIFDKWGWVIGGLFTFIGSILGGLWAMLKFQAYHYERLLAAKDLYIKNLSESNATKDEKNDTWFRKYLESVTGHKTNGKEEVKK